MKLNFNNLVEAQKKVDFKKHQIKIENKDFEIGILQSLKDRHKKEIFDRFMTYLGQHAESEETSTVCGIIALLEIITDIDFPDSFEEKVDFVIALGEEGMSSVMSLIPEKVIEESTEAIQKLGEEVVELLKEVSKKDESDQAEAGDYKEDSSE